MYWYVGWWCLIPVKQVFSDLDFLGWYTTGEAPTPSDIKIHKQVAAVFVIHQNFVSCRRINVFS